MWCAKHSVEPQKCNTSIKNEVFDSLMSGFVPSVLFSSCEYELFYNKYPVCISLPLGGQNLWSVQSAFFLICYISAYFLSFPLIFQPHCITVLTAPVLHLHAFTTPTHTHTHLHLASAMQLPIFQESTQAISSPPLPPPQSYFLILPPLNYNYSSSTVLLSFMFCLVCNCRDI